MIVHLPRRKKHFPLSNPIPGIEHVEKLNILGITVIVSHFIIMSLLWSPKCSRSFYALKTIRAHGLNSNALLDIIRATLVSQLQYACAAWWGYLKADERNQLQSIVSKAIRYGYLPRSFCTLDELREDADEQLFFSSRYNPNHVLH